MAKHKMKRKKERGIERESKKQRKDDMPEDKKPSIAVALGIIALIIIIIYAPSLLKNENKAGNEAKIKGSYLIHSDIPGDAEPGKVKMLVFFDLYCPHCFNFDTTVLPSLKAKYGDKLEVTSVGYPLAKRSILPILGYEAALKLGKGEEFKQLAFRKIHVEGRDISSKEALAGIAEEIGLDTAAFLKELDNLEKSGKINQNIALGNRYKLKGTPLIILNGNIEALNPSFENVDAIISSLLEE